MDYATGRIKDEIFPAGQFGGSPCKLILESKIARFTLRVSTARRGTEPHRKSVYVFETKCLTNFVVNIVPLEIHLIPEDFRSIAFPCVRHANKSQPKRAVFYMRIKLLRGKHL